MSSINTGPTTALHVPRHAAARFDKDAQTTIRATHEQVPIVEKHANMAARMHSVLATVAQHPIEGGSRLEIAFHGDGGPLAARDAVVNLRRTLAYVLK